MRFRRSKLKLLGGGLAQQGLLKKGTWMPHKESQLNLSCTEEALSVMALALRSVYGRSFTIATDMITPKIPKPYLTVTAMAMAVLP